MYSFRQNCCSERKKKGVLFISDQRIRSIVWQLLYYSGKLQWEEHATLVFFVHINTSIAILPSQYFKDIFKPTLFWFLINLSLLIHFFLYNLVLFFHWSVLVLWVISLKYVNLKYLLILIIYLVIHKTEN